MKVMGCPIYRMKNISMRDFQYQDLFKKRMGAIKPGLERMVEAKQALSLPGTPLSILVGGTNGKGSTCGFLHSILGSSGYKVGLYSSPHLVSFHERFLLNDLLASDEQILVALKYLQQVLSEDLYKRLSFFEVATLLSFILFSSASLDVGIYEVGLGGRFDATNIIEPDVSVITSIGLDHQEYLGSSVRNIAFEKAGIMREEKYIYIGRVVPEALEVLLKEAGVKGSIPKVFGVDFGWDSKGVFYTEDDNMRHYHLWPDSLCSSPDYQKDNYALAVAVFAGLELNRGNNGVLLKALSTQPVIKTPNMFGRCSYVQGSGQRFLLDCCHNEEGVRAFSKFVQSRYRGSIPGVVTVLKDKDVDKLLTLFRGFLDPIVLFKVDSERSLTDMDGITDCENMTLADSFAEALHIMGQKVKNDSDWAVCGSVFGVGEAIGFLQKTSAYSMDDGFSFLGDFGSS